MESPRDIFLGKYSSFEAFNGDFNLEDLEMLEKIGKGAFANVFKARLTQNINSEMPELVAVKVLEKRFLEKINSIDMAVHEVKLLAVLSNTFIIDFYTSFTSIDDVYIVLEWMPFDLFTILQSKVYFGEHTARYIGSQVILALEYMHSLHIAYRDLKPENLLVGNNRGIKLTDMSFAKYISGRSYTSQGTVEYMAPEVVMCSGHGLAVDLWAYGVLLYEICAGHTPFKTQSTLNLMRNIITAKFKFPQHFSEELMNLIKKLLVVDVSKRLGCMKDKENDIKLHPWFDGDVDWNLLELQQYDIPRELMDLEDVRRKTF